MIPLVSEIDITTVSLPLASYPDALKLAAKYVHDNKPEKAKEVLYIAIKYLDGANEALNVAEKLGYVSKSETTYKMLHEKIEEVKKEIKGKNKAEKLFESLAEKLKEFKSKIIKCNFGCMKKSQIYFILSEKRRG